MSNYWTRWDATNSKWEVSVDGAAFTDLLENAYLKVAKFKAEAAAIGSGAYGRIFEDASSNLTLDAGSGGGSIISTQKHLFKGDSQFYIDIASGYPWFNFDTNDYLYYDRTYNYFGLVIGSAVVALFASGASKICAPQAFVYNNADISINSGSATLMTFNSENSDPLGFHSTSVNTSRLTIPTGMAGRYIFRAHITWEGVASPAGYRIIRIEKGSAGTPNYANAVAVTQVQACVTASTPTLQECISDPISMADGEYCEVMAVHNQGAAVKATGSSNWGLVHGGILFSCYRVSD